MKQRSAHIPTLWSLRPAGEHAALRLLLQAKGLRLRALPSVRLVGCAPNAVLEQALAARLRVFTSPAAVRFASRLAALSQPGQHLNIAVGEGTALALKAAGVEGPLAPSRMDSEGVLDLPVLAQVQGQRVGLFTAPGGRGLLSAVLAERGATVLRADVYERLALPLKMRALSALAADASAILMASSAEALAHFQNALDRLPPAQQGAVRARPLVVSSARLAHWAEQQGFQHVEVADSARPESLCDAAVKATSGRSMLAHS